MTKITDLQIDCFFGEYERFSPKKARTYSQKQNFSIRRLKAMVKRDCFAYRRARCNVLTEMVCKYGECSFYKTISQDREDRKKYRFDKTYKSKDEEK